jgi:hypothetical protein
MPEFRTRSHLPRRAATIAACALAIALPAWAGDAFAQDAPTPPPAPKLDRFRVKIDLPPAAAATTASPESGQIDSTPAPASLSGRLILFFTPDSPRWADRAPIDAPFFEKPQPLAAISVDRVEGGAFIEIDPIRADAFGDPLRSLNGTFRVQALLDLDNTVRGHLAPGNLVSEIVSVELASDRVDSLDLVLSKAIAADPAPPEDSGVVWVERRSDLLSRHFGRPTVLRAGVVVPYGYHDLAFDRRFWPSVYVVPGFGGTRLSAIAAAPALQEPDARAAVPQAVWIYLDAETIWGHHGFCDSESNGPVGRALVEEFIPFLEERFRLVARTEARLVTGHSSGGWTAMHLALDHPETFGACFASAPDPVDFTAFQKTDLYRDRSLFAMQDGRATPSYRGILGPEEDRVFMNVEDEYAVEQVLDPTGRSGQQWSAWEAMWSPVDAARAGPRRICDPATGAIDLETVAAWSRHDIARRIDAAFASGDDTLARILAERVRLVVGSRDSYYLNEAVARLRARLDGWRARAEERGAPLPNGPGFIEILDGLTHDTAYPVAQLRFHRAMQDHLRAHGLASAPSVDRARVDPAWSESAPSPGRDARPRVRP